MNNAQDAMLRESHTMLGEMRVHCKECRKQVMSHELILDGDNGDGLRTRTTVNEKAIEKMEGSIQRTIKGVWGLATGVVTVIVGTIANWLKG